LARGDGRRKGQGSKDVPRTVSRPDATASRAAQFNSTPRFIFPSSTDQPPSVRAPTFGGPLSARRQRQTSRNDDDIADFDSQERHRLAPDDDPDESRAESNDAQDIDGPASKRARMSLDSDLSDLDSAEHPRAPKTVSPALRFRMRPSRVVEGSEPPGSTHPSRPVFILPDSPEERHNVELPAIFSPHRKSQRFIPGGLADSMRTQIMEAFSEQHRGSSHASHGGVRLRVSACRSTSQATLIQGLSDSGSEGHVLLIGHKKRPAVGDIVLAKGASWEVVIDEKTWVVYLDWKVE
jgi:hypothetical protein